MLLTKTPTLDWESHYEKYVNPELMTSLLRKGVPILDAVDWRVSDVQLGFVRSHLPINEMSTNQHGTHQGALLAMVAEYTGGLALATHLTGIPLSGVHPCNNEQAASLWLGKMTMKYRSPSIGPLSIESQVSSDSVRSTLRRYDRGQRSLLDIAVIIRSESEVLAEAEMKYFVQPSRTLRQYTSAASASPIHRTKLKASAQLIAGVRAQDTARQSLRVDCPHAAVAAGPHGNMLAQKLANTLPSLTDMIHARTQHIDNAIFAMPKLTQIVSLGVGLDMRPFRLMKRLPDVAWFELDLPEMLKERERVIRDISDIATPVRYSIAADFVHDDVEALVLKCPEFDSCQPTIFLFEGCSMYFEESTNARILECVNRLRSHPDSRLWFDSVNEAVVKQATPHKEVWSFIEGMREMGESFIFGTDEPDLFARACGFNEVQSVTVAQHLDTSDPICSLYSFTLAR